MSWQDQITEAKFTAPSGKEFIFSYREVSKETDLKTATFTFPERDGAYIQALGIGGRRFPLACYFFGANCLTEATAFETALEERGYSELQHPVYGIRKVVPTGTIKRSDNLVGALNQSLVDVVFSETIIEETFPDSTVLTEDVISSDLESFSDAAATEFVENMNPVTASESIKAQVVMINQTRSIKDFLEPLAKQDPSIWTEFQTLFSALESSLDDFVNEKLTIARQIIRLAKLPSRIITAVLAKIEGYSHLIADLIDVFTRDPVGAENVKNQFIATRLALQTAITSVVSGVALTATTPGTFFSRGDAIDAVVLLLELYDAIIEFCDSKISKDLFVDVGSGYEQMNKVVSKGITFIVNASFGLPSRRILILDKDRQMIELVAELHGGLDKLEQFIIDNKLNIDDMELLPSGRSVVYYV